MFLKSYAKLDALQFISFVYKLDVIRRKKNGTRKRQICLWIQCYKNDLCQEKGKKGFDALMATYVSCLSLAYTSVFLELSQADHHVYSIF
jgi:hypothetical protein